jgi:pimeloyl-ACP methyl ester carboxylesterase
LVWLEGFAGGPLLPAARTLVDYLAQLPDAFATPDAAGAALRPLVPHASAAALQHWVRHGFRPAGAGAATAGPWGWRMDPVLRATGPQARTINPSPDYLQPLLPQLRCPVLLVCGADSFQQEAMAQLAGTLPQAHTALVPGAGHFVVVDNAPGVLAVVQAFLSAGHGGAR